MKNFFLTLAGTVTLILLVQTGCDLAIDAGDGGVLEYDHGSMDSKLYVSLEAAIADLGTEVQLLMTPCHNPSYTWDDIKRLGARADSLLGLTDVGITSAEFAWEIERVTLEQWEQVDSAALAQVKIDYESLLPPGCGDALDTLQARAEELLIEHVGYLQGLGHEGFSLLVESVLVGNTQGECEDRCQSHYAADATIAVGTALVAGAGCSAITLGIAAGICFIGAAILYGGMGMKAEVNRDDCLAACSDVCTGSCITRKEDHTGRRK